MSDPNVSEVAVPITSAEPPPITPFEFLQQFADAPSQEQIDSLKSQAPGRRLRLFHSTDAKRVYIMRGIGGAELAQLCDSCLHPHPPIRPLFTQFVRADHRLV